MSSDTPDLALPLLVAEVPAWSGVRRLAITIDHAIGTLSESVGAALVLAETCILLPVSFRATSSTAR